MKTSKNKWLKIMGATLGIGAISCIIPICIVSCGSSSSSASNSNSTPTSNSNSSAPTNSQPASLPNEGDLVTSDLTSLNTHFSSTSFIKVTGVNLSTQELATWNDCTNIYQVNGVSTNTYEINANNYHNAKYTWYVIKAAQVANDYASLATNNHSYPQFVRSIETYGSVIKDAVSYTYSYTGAISSKGLMFCCTIEINGQTFYSKITWLESGTSTNNPLHVGTYQLALGTTPNTSISVNSVSIDATKDEVLKYSLTLGSLEGQNLTASNFANTNYAVEYVLYNNNQDQYVVSKPYDLANTSSWTYNLSVSPGYWSFSIRILGNNEQLISLANLGNTYEIICQFATIGWESTDLPLPKQDAIAYTTAGTTWYPTFNYYWQDATSANGTFSNIVNNANLLYPSSGTSSQYENTNFASFIQYEINVNNNLYYRLKIVNANDPSQYFYSNVLSASSYQYQ